MEKYIYREFTHKNGIILNIQSLKFLSSNLKTRQEIDNYLKKFLDKAKTKKPQICELKRLLEIDNAKKQITHFQINKTSFIDRLKFLKDKLSVKITSIYLLKNEFCYIFGRYSRNKSDLEVLEDESGSVLVNCDDYNGNAFVCDGMFICFGGMMDGNIFCVSEIIYPSFGNCSDQNQNVPRKTFPVQDKDVLIFNEFDWDLDKIKKEFSDKTDTSFVFFKTFTIPQLATFVDFLKFKKGNLELKNGHTEFSKEVQSIRYIEGNNNRVFIVPYVESSLLPIHTFGFESRMLATNPCLINIPMLWAFIKNDIFYPKVKGRFFGNNHYYCYFKAYLSQYSANPYNSSDFSLNKLPEFFVCATKHLSFSLDIDNIKVSVLNDYSENREYLFYSGTEKHLYFKRLE